MNLPPNLMANPHQAEWRDFRSFGFKNEFNRFSEFMVIHHLRVSQIVILNNFSV